MQSDFDLNRKVIREWRITLSVRLLQRHSFLTSHGYVVPKVRDLSWFLKIFLIESYPEALPGGR